MFNTDDSEISEIITAAIHDSSGIGLEDTSSLKFMILEGDWNNKEIPQCFEGIKSAGESGKIQVLSRGKNLFNKDSIYYLNVVTGKTIRNLSKFGSSFIVVKPNTSYM
ncbi:hypothetical protein [Clostridium tetani]|uniref:hypothetical protein n=1 Tax=Clostridium tetani TaxID=1513 RepID=UPI0003C0DAAF|nr:hypothetical protein [Clostridium tetani]CDI49628.1 hypothetical protein BN906_01631 [Clostridium tetani 12124569]KGI39918.1 hypothetical protein LA33_04290 [Clostridium tetani ATCC 9441]KGI43972.1 hypothetical protein KY55_06085 [Clostridium tetani]SUY66584.1 Uncharacterised protein [Clostridium tetani]BDR86790.1 hypothetical protein N071400001_13980 [Clostridium tetani]